MLGAKPFYYRTIRRNVISFGSIFNNIEMLKYAANTNAEISRVNVPLSYAGKENFLTRLLGNPDLHKPTQIVLPRMSFEMTNISYDPSRKLSSYLSSFNKSTNTSVSQQYQGVPYNLDFELNLYVRNVEDGTQIIEQILPFFNPDYTISMNFVDEMEIIRDVPILLESVDYDPNYSGTEETVRILTWTLKFKMKTYFFGPINTGALIRQSTANTYIYTGEVDRKFELNLTNMTRDFKIGEFVYVGSNLPDATAIAQVVSWSNTSNVLIVIGNSGTLTANQTIRGSLSNASAEVYSILPQVGLAATLIVTPDPPTANLGDDFGFTTEYIEYNEVITHL
jgi:hypothetical protein